MSTIYIGHLVSPEYTRVDIFKYRKLRCMWYCGLVINYYITRLCSIK